MEGCGSPIAAVVFVGGAEEQSKATADELSQSWGACESELVRIVTKYYTADVAIQCVGWEAADALVASREVQAVVAVVHAGEAQAVVAQEWWQNMQQVESKACLVWGELEASASVKIRNQLLEYGVELVDQQSKNRLKEILEVTMWSSMNLKGGGADQNQQPNARKDVVDSTCGLGLVKGDGSPLKETGEDSTVNQACHPDESTIDTMLHCQDKKEEQALKELMVQDELEDGVEINDFDFDAMITKMTRIRENCDNLSEDDRKEAAAQLALQFAAMLGMDED